MKSKSSRISFSQSDAAHLYDLALGNFQVSKKEGICALCEMLKKRLEKFVGSKEVRAIKYRNKKYGYRN